jgi:hypothetical protein
VPHQGRHGPGSDAGPPPPQQVLVAHGRVWRDGKAWTLAHERWLLTQRFTEPALITTYDHYRVVLQGRHAQLEAIEADLAVWQDRAPFAEAVARLSAYRGVTRLGALHLAAEVGDWRRFARASAFMGLCGLVPSEYSTGQTTRRGHIIKAGNVHLRTQLVESAWATSTAPASASTSPDDSRAWTPRWSPGPGPLSYGCAGGSDAWPPASPPPTSSPPPSRGSWPGSCGPR